MNTQIQIIPTPEAVKSFALAIENPDQKTTQEGRLAYMRIAYEDFKDPKMHDCFFAFGKDQFQDAIKAHHLEDALKQGRIRSGGAGLYGTAEGLRRLHEDLGRREVEQRIALTAAAVTPQDCYLAEYDNYECMFDWDGDLRALRRVAFWFGADSCRRIRRKGFNGITVEQFINKNL